MLRVIKKHEIQAVAKLHRDMCHHIAELKLPSRGEVQILPDFANLEYYLTYENMVCGFFFLMEILLLKVSQERSKRNSHEVLFSLNL